MRKMYLTSFGLGKLSSILSKSISETKVAFIPTAADPYADKWFMEADVKKLTELGYILTQVDLKEKNEDQLKVSLQGINMVYVCGGNSFYLLEKIYESGFDIVIKDLINKGVVYAGASAGAVNMGPTIEPLAELDDPSQAPNLQSTNG